MKIDILELKITAEPKAEVLAEISARVTQGTKTLVVTPYSEFFYYAAKDYRFRIIVNNADYALPDGMSVPWLADFFSKPLTASNYYLKIVQASAQLLASGLSMLFVPSRRSAIIPSRIAGADFFWELVAEAHRTQRKVFLLGGFDDTTKLAAEAVLKRFPGLHLAFSNANPHDQQSVELINAFRPDYLFVAYGPVKQEYWIAEHLQTIHATMAMGIGGTLDYVAGTKRRAPQFMRTIGMEWLYRLITQPYRAKRIWHATGSLALGAVRDKVFKTLGYRQNAAAVIINEQGSVLVVCRCRESKKVSKEAHWQFPQGGIEDDETPEQGVLREMKEELGTDAFDILGTGSKIYTYKWQHFFRPLFWNTRRYQGQSQHIFYLKFNGVDLDFKLDTHEIDSFKWVHPSELRTYIHPMRHAMLDVAMHELSEYARPSSMEPSIP